MTKSAGYYKLRQALAETGCPLCRVLAETADNYVDAVLWELVNDIESRQKLRQSLGYCREHTWLLVRHGAALGTAIMMKDLLDTLLALITPDKIQDTTSTGFSFRQVWQTFNSAQPVTNITKITTQLTPQLPCPVCTHVQTTETYLLESLLKHLTGSDNLWEAYQHSDGMCLAHFRLAVQQAPTEAALSGLLQAQKVVWQRLSSQLGEFIRKNDYRFQGEGFGPEADAWLRAVEAMAGPPPVKPKTQF